MITVATLFTRLYEHINLCIIFYSILFWLDFQWFCMITFSKILFLFVLIALSYLRLLNPSTFSSTLLFTCLFDLVYSAKICTWTQVFLCFCYQLNNCAICNSYYCFRLFSINIAYFIVFVDLWPFIHDCFFHIVFTSVWIHWFCH